MEGKEAIMARIEYLFSDDFTAGNCPCPVCLRCCCDSEKCVHIKAGGGKCFCQEVYSYAVEQQKE